MNVLIVDSHVLFREGLQSLLAREPQFGTIGLAATGAEAVYKASQLKPDLVLLDIGLVDGSGPHTLRELMAQRPGCSVVVLTSREHEHYVVEAFSAGARGFLLKETPTAELVAALLALRQGQLAVTGPIIQCLVDELHRQGRQAAARHLGAERLTRREIEVLPHIETGASNREIAARLHISEHTVKVHVRNILDKLRLKRRSQVIHLARHSAPGAVAGGRAWSPNA